MSQAHHLTPRLLDFPVEILLDILGHLDVCDLVRARRVSTKLFCVRIINSIFPGMQPCSTTDRLFVGAAVFDRPRILQCDSSAFNAWLGPFHPNTSQVASTKRIRMAES